MNTELFRQAIDEIKTHLPDYLEEHEIDPAQQFRCLHPNHNDKHPSCGIPEGSTNFNCLSCGATGDIFHAAHYLEDKPLAGKAWLHENVKYLADKFEIELPESDLSESDLYEIDTYRAYKEAAHYISDRANGSHKLFDKEVDRRSWDKELLQKLLVGTVEFQAYKSYMKSIGFSVQFLEDVDLLKKDLFNEEHMIFTVCDEYARPCGFAARNLVYDKNNKKSGTKYVNQKTTGAKCNIYKKGKRLYNFHNAVKSTPPIIIFEGYADVITAIHNGITNVACIGGTAFTSDHIITLKENDQYDVVLCLDGDAQGQTKAEKLLDDKFSEHKDMRIRLINLPDDKDPDDFIRENGAEEFNELTKFDSFAWRLENFDELAIDPQDICSNMIPFIVNEKNHVNKEVMANNLSMYTGVSVKSIQNELSRLDNATEMEAQEQRNLILEKMNKEIRKDPTDAQGILSITLSELENVSKVYNMDNFSQEFWVDTISTSREKEDLEGDANPGFKLNRLQLFESMLKGPWTQDVLLLFGGSPNTGKTALMANLAYDIATSNDNVCVIFHTIDDSINQFLPRLVCIASNDIDFQLNHVVNPVYYNDKQILKSRTAGYDKVMELAQEGKLIVKDSSSGATLNYGEGLVKYYQNKYPDKQIVYFLDNFHKLQDSSGNDKDERIKFKQFSHYVKNYIAIKYHVPVIATVEYTKLEPTQRPNNSNVSESVQMEYDCNFMAHLYNEMHGRGHNAELFHRAMVYGEEMMLPRIELAVGKNKITSFKDKMYFDFYPASSLYKSCEKTTAIQEGAAIAKGNVDKLSHMKGGRQYKKSMKGDN